ncbi:MAG: VUT family protein [SAR324 cluster bacterium]|nr:VUT family protein [SAR324 cluster bacterium]
MLAVIIYLIAIVVANITILWFGPQAAIINAFILIGLDLSLRDKLHDQWHGKHLWLKMLALICGGSVITIVLNWDALAIAIASSTAFFVAGIGDALLYAKLRKYKFLIRSNGSNIAGSALDSFIFPTMAFGIIMPEIIIGQFVAKIAGGAIWSLVLQKTYLKEAQ